MIKKHVKFGRVSGILRELTIGEFIDVMDSSPEIFTDNHDNLDYQTLLSIVTPTFSGDCYKLKPKYHEQMILEFKTVNSKMFKTEKTTNTRNKETVQKAKMLMMKDTVFKNINHLISVGHSRAMQYPYSTYLQFINIMSKQ